MFFSLPNLTNNLTNFYSFQFKFGHRIDSKTNDNVREGIIFSTYSTLIAKAKTKQFKTRIDQLVDWFGSEYDGCIIYDECHKAKNISVTEAKSTKTGNAVLELQMKLPQARIVYVSATGASEPRHMGYMVRLGLWGITTPFKDFNSFMAVVESR